MTPVSQESEPGGQIVRDALPDAERLARLRYARWVTRRGVGGPREDDYRRRVRDLWRGRPLFEIFLFLEKGGEALLADSIDSLAGQYYDGWHLVIFAPTPSPEPDFARDEGAVRWIRISEDAPLAEAVNARLAASTADWVGFFACGTRFSPDFLLSLGDYVALHPEWRLIYTDEDAFDAEGELHTPLFKPDFNLELLRSTDYIGGLAVERRSLVAAGGYPLLDDAACYDLALRVVDACGDESAGHIAEVLQHVPPAAFRRAGAADAAKALSAHLARRGIAAEVGEGLLAGTTRRVIYRHPGTPKVSIIIPTRNRLELLGPCVESLLKHTAWPDWELLLVDNGSDDPNVRAYYDALRAALPERARVLDHPEQFNFSAMNNRAAREARGEYLLLLNNDTECIHDDWLDAMMSQAQRADVGLVGARLLYPGSLKIQHGGVVLGMLGVAEHVFYGTPYDHPGYLNRAQADQEYSAVTGACQLLRKSLFEEMGGLDERFRICGDTDLGLKIRRRGYRIIWTPFATLLHHGSGTFRRGLGYDPEQLARLQEESAFFCQLRKDALRSDPAWNRNLSLASSSPVVDDELAVPWNPDFHDRPRVAAMPAINHGVAEYRCLAPLRALHAAGKLLYTTIHQPRPGCERVPTPVELARMASDTLLMHAPVGDMRCQALLHYQTFNPEVFLIYALDDLITDIPRENPIRDLLPAEVMKERLRLGLAASHRLIVSTEPLAEACRQWIDDVRVVPNTLDWHTWGKLPSRRRRGPRLRVGWAGAQQHAGDLRLLRDVIAATRQEVDWVFLGMMPEGLDSRAVEFHGHVHFAAYPAKLASLDLDLALAPLAIHPFNEAKSNLRLLEYGALGWPVLCTDIFPYRADDPPVARLANDAGKWIAAIRERAADPDALARQGDALRAWVKKHYLLENRLDQWFAALTR